nr:MAG TPA: hypothetical protein [Crassvirales sp.]
MTPEFIYAAWWSFYLQFQIIDSAIYTACFGQPYGIEDILTTQHTITGAHIYLSKPGWVALLVGLIIDTQILLLFAAILDVAVKKRIDTLDT